MSELMVTNILSLWGVLGFIIIVIAVCMHSGRLEDSPGTTILILFALFLPVTLPLALILGVLWVLNKAGKIVVQGITTWNE